MSRLHPALGQFAGALQSSLRRAAEALRRRQQPDGCWRCDTDIGPIGIASQLIVERLFDAIDPHDVGPGLRYFARQQLEDGSFPPYPGARCGSATTTALVWAALLALEIEPEHLVVRRARAYVDAHGELEGVREAFIARGDPAALFLVATGHLAARGLPRVPPGVGLVAHGRILQSRVHAGNVMTMIVLAALGERDADAKPGLFAATRRALGRVGATQYLCRWQNPDGSWNGSPLQTTLMLAGLHASGMTRSDRPIKRALAWLRSMKRHQGDELRQNAMDNDVWSTALCTLALHAAGEPIDGDVLAPAVAHLLATQSREPMPAENQRRIGAKRTGGWPFQRGNETMPDTDDTGVVIAVLSQVTGHRGTRAAFTAIDEGVAWLRDMQNPDGGFPTFVWGLPSKAPGPMFTADMPVRLDDPQALVRAFTAPPPEYGDPSLEGVTGRVLWGLGSAGIRRDDPAVRDAVDFLRAQQCESGAWWGRWKACYLAETATVLIGLAAVGEDMDAAWIRRAVAWVVACQNEDGGFGEDAEAYRSPARAGVGSSSAAVTAYVLLGLVAADLGRSEAAARAVAWLLGAQDAEGSWDNGGWLHTFVPPHLLYTYDLPAQALPMVALARWSASNE
jgi:prenyltransferase beta subunit